MGKERDPGVFSIPICSDSDYIHDITHSLTGTRLAMCTSSQSIIVWERSADDWRPRSTITSAHNGPIWRLDWAHPEFGQIIASCSEDRSVAVWSERSTIQLQPSTAIEWKKRATLTDSAYAVTDVQFAPRIFGLKFAACSSDGSCRAYFAPDVLNLAYWEVEDLNTSDKVGCTALSWCPSDEIERICVTFQNGSLSVFEKSSQWETIAHFQVASKGSALKDCSWAPNICRDSEWIACCGDDSTVEILSLRDRSLEHLHRISTFTSPIWRVAWNLTATVLAIAPESGVVQSWRLAGPTVLDWEKIDPSE